MKSIITLIALGCTGLASAGQYGNMCGNISTDCSSCNYGGGQYRSQIGRGGYCDPSNQSQANQGYYQTERPYYQDQSQYNYQQQWSREDNQPYYADQQKYSPPASDYRDTPAYDGNSKPRKEDNQQPISDMEIKKKIDEKLNSVWFSKGFKNVTFDVNHGNINLRGSVDSIENKNLVEDNIKKIDGVRSVHSEIMIVKENSDSYPESKLQDSEKKHPQDSASTREDRQLNAKIREKLSGWLSEGNEALIIRTTNGVVIIAGPVEKVEDIQKTIDRIKEVGGVKAIKSELTVKNK